MSQGSVSSQELLREIDECIEVHDKLLEFSKQGDTLILPENMAQHQFVQGTTIPNPGFQQAVNAPLPPPPTMQQFAQETTISNPVFQQAINTPLPPPPTMQQFWTSEEINILHEHKLYFEKMIVIIDKAEREGPQKLPKKPKRKLEQLFSEKSGKKKARKLLSTPLDLHVYLQNNIADTNTAISRESFADAIFSSSTSEVEIVKRLQKGMRNLKRQDAQTFMIYIQFGNFLNLCKAWQEEGRINQTWATWLKEKTGYSNDHARKLHVVSNVLFGYNHFYKVALPISFIISKINDIKAMLQVPEFNEYWKQNFIIPSTAQLHQSQE